MLPHNELKMTTIQGATGGTIKQWINMCVSWRSSDGEAKYYRDGELISTKYLGQGEKIKRGGTLVLFQVGDRSRENMYVSTIFLV